MIKSSNVDKYLLSKDQHYCLPGLNEIKFISHKQTMSLVLGSCVSTVFVGRGNGQYFLGANHIVLADPRKGSVVATKGAQEQIEEVISFYTDYLHVPTIDYCCLHLVGGGRKDESNFMQIHENNSFRSKEILANKGYYPIFIDVGNYYYVNYSIYNNNVSIFVENKFSKVHLSFIMDMGRLLNNGRYMNAASYASAIEPGDVFFDELITKKIITDVTGEKNRASVLING